MNSESKPCSSIKSFFSLFDLKELKALIIITLPLYIANLVHVGMGLVDTMVAGSASSADLAGVAMGSAISWPVLAAFGGVLTILAPIISRLRGEGRYSRVGFVLNNAKWISFILMLIAGLILYALSHVFSAVSDDAHSAAVAQQYVIFMILSVPASMLMRVVQGHFEGFGQTRPAMIMALVALVLNYPINHAFVFGWGPIPAMGGAGCGLVTALMHWLIVLGLIVMMFASRRHRPYARQLFTWASPHWAQIKSIVSLGIPIGVANFCEFSFFSAMTLVIAPLGNIAVSAQQISLNISSVLFMLPLSLGVAVAIRSSYYIGIDDRAGFHRLVSTLIISALSAVCVLMTLTVFIRYSLIAQFSDSQEIVDIAQVLIILCAIYQIPDAIQALMSGLLRGCHDTKIITWVNLGSYWIIGFPLAYALIRTDWIVPALGPAGAWISFIVALTITASLLTARFLRTRKTLFLGK